MPGIYRRRRISYIRRAACPAAFHRPGRDNASLFVQGVRHLSVCMAWMYSKAHDVSVIFHGSRFNLGYIQVDEEPKLQRLVFGASVYFRPRD